MLDYESVLADASHLPIPDRIQLIEALWNTMPADSLPPLTRSGWPRFAGDRPSMIPGMPTGRRGRR